MGKSIGIFRTFDIFSDECFLGTFDEPNNFCLSFFTVYARFGNLNLDSIAIERSVSFAFTDEKYLARRGFDESEVWLNLGIDSGTVLGFHAFYDNVCMKYMEEQKKCEFLFSHFLGGIRFVVFQASLNSPVALGTRISFDDSNSPRSFRNTMKPENSFILCFT